MTQNVKQHLNKSTYILHMVTKTEEIISDFSVCTACVCLNYLMHPMNVIEIDSNKFIFFIDVRPDCILVYSELNPIYVFCSRRYALDYCLLSLQVFNNIHETPFKLLSSFYNIQLFLGNEIHISSPWRQNPTLAESLSYKIRNQLCAPEVVLPIKLLCSKSFAQPSFPIFSYCFIIGGKFKLTNSVQHVLRLTSFLILRFFHEIYCIST